MTSKLQPIFLHGHPGPNPWKIALLLTELGIPYTTKVYTTPELKTPEFLAINPYAKTPVIEDPNTGVKIAEKKTKAENLICWNIACMQSGAIMDYIITQYDKSHTISFSTLPEKWQMHQYLQQQCTTQGPLLQLIFRYTNTEPNPSARASAVAQFRDYMRVLNDELKGKEWLVGGKCSAADLSFVAFQEGIPRIVGVESEGWGEEFGEVERWMGGLRGRGSVREVGEERGEALKRVAAAAAAASEGKK
ncbi:MAG: hypothetical protein Q9220_001763 [cf. Caloplaca sp. 1 TL-2023]